MYTEVVTTSGLREVTFDEIELLVRAELVARQLMNHTYDAVVTRHCADHVWSNREDDAYYGLHGLTQLHQIRFLLGLKHSDTFESKWREWIAEPE